MSHRNATSAYAQSAIESAPPLKIIHMLYEGALRFLEQASAIDHEADPQGYTNKLNRAQDIVSELRISLDPEPAPEIAKRLSELYLFVEDQIHEAIVHSEPERLAPAQDVLTTLLSAWKELEVQTPRASA